MEIRERILLIWLAMARYEETATRVALGDNVVEAAKYNYVHSENRKFHDVEVVQKFNWRLVDGWCQEQLDEMKKGDSDA